jgi:hypothetical protein
MAKTEAVVEDGSVKIPIDLFVGRDRKEIKENISEN